MRRPKRPKWERKVRWFLWGDDMPDWLLSTTNRVDWTRPALRVLCVIFGHQPERDQCDLPEHDYCLACGILLPGKAH